MAVKDGSKTLDVAACLERLASGVSDLGDSAHWKRYLDTQAAFHDYSFNNCILIMMQNPEATRVAGFHTWLKLGRSVRKGEHGIRILAPLTFKRDDVDSDSPSAERVVRGFRAVSVFDISQTDGEELPEVATLLDGEDTEGVYARLVEVAHGLEFCVVNHEFHGESNGDCSHSERLIRVEWANSETMRVKTLAHELGHAILHADRSIPREMMELEAESVAYVVCQALGIESDSYSFGYLLSWGEDAATSAAAIKASGTRIAQAAKTILGALSARSAELVSA